MSAVLYAQSSSRMQRDLDFNPSAGSVGAVKRNPSNADAKLVRIRKLFLRFQMSTEEHHTLHLQPKPKSVPIKKEAVKIEPLSPKSEPEDLPQQGKKPRAKKGEGEKRVVVKKEYEKPGQTRETPSEVGLLLEAHTNQACLVPAPSLHCLSRQHPYSR